MADRNRRRVTIFDGVCLFVCLYVSSTAGERRSNSQNSHVASCSSIVPLNYELTNL